MFELLSNNKTTELTVGSNYKFSKICIIKLKHKSIQRMPWVLMPKKDVEHCDKLRLDVFINLNLRSPNGETR
jgi:hypothetical protein